MYCTYKIPLVHEDTDVTVVITEVDYIPAQRLTHYQEGFPELVLINSGYVFDDQGHEVSFDKVLTDHGGFLTDRTLELYNRELYEEEVSSWQ